MTLGDRDFTIAGETMPNLPTGWTVKNSGFCKDEGCRQPIFWARTPEGRMSPVDPDGTSHFATCIAASRFRTPSSSQVGSSLSGSSSPPGSGAAAAVAVVEAARRVFRSAIMHDGTMADVSAASLAELEAAVLAFDKATGISR